MIGDRKREAGIDVSQSPARKTAGSNRLNVREIAIFGMLGALMYASKILMDAFPNIHLIGTLITAITIVYRRKALYPIYVFVFLTGFLHGFANWWIPYLYIWTVLWGMVMLVPQKKAGGREQRGKLPAENVDVACLSGKNSWRSRLRPLIYMSVCAAHGFLYGVLYAPVQALMFGLNFEGMVAWIVAGLPFDITHGISNFCCGALIMPIVSALRMAERSWQ